MRIAALASVVVGGGNTTGAPALPAAVALVANQTWGASGMMALDAEGDLYRAVYDVYAVDADAGWGVVGEPVDGRAL